MKPHRCSEAQYTMFGTPSDQVVAIDVDDRQWPDHGAAWYLREAYGRVPETARVPLSEEAAHHRLIYRLPRVLSSHVSLIISKTIVIWSATSYLPADLQADLVEAPEWLVELVEDAGRGVYPDDIWPGKPVNLLGGIADAPSLVDGGEDAAAEAVDGASHTSISGGVDGGRPTGVDGVIPGNGKTSVIEADPAADGGRDSSVDGVSAEVSSGVDGGEHSRCGGVDGGLKNVDGVVAAVREYLSSAADYEADGLPPFRRDGYHWFYAAAFARSTGAITGSQEQAVYELMRKISVIESRRPIRVISKGNETVARMHRVPSKWVLEDQDDQTGQ